jgi:hypothetical protein
VFERNSPSLLLSVFDSGVDDLGVLGVLDSGEDEGRVGGSVLRLVSGNGCERLKCWEGMNQRPRVATSDGVRASENVHSKSPESETTVVNFLSCSSEEDMLNR